MSKAFTKEDAEVPERDGRKRSVSGLPPGAANYMTASGAEYFRRELEKLEERARRGTATAKADRGIAERIADLRELLRGVTVVPARTEAPGEVLFGTWVTLRSVDGKLSRHRIVGVDEAGGEAVSWCSPMGRALLGAEVGQRVQLHDGTKVSVVEISP